jgi:hypothetical protein
MSFSVGNRIMKSGTSMIPSGVRKRTAQKRYKKSKTKHEEIVCTGPLLASRWQTYAPWLSREGALTVAARVARRGKKRSEIVIVRREILLKTSRYQQKRCWNVARTNHILQHVVANLRHGFAKLTRNCVRDKHIKRYFAFRCSAWCNVREAEKTSETSSSANI